MCELNVNIALNDTELCSIGFVEDTISESFVLSDNSLIEFGSCIEEIHAPIGIKQDSFHSYDDVSPFDKTSEQLALDSSVRSRVAKHKLKSLYRSNKRLHKKMELVINLLKNAINGIATRNKAERTLQDKMTDVVQSPIKEHVRFPLEIQGNHLLEKIKFWSAAEPDHREIISLLEKYKRAVTEYIHKKRAKSDKIIELLTGLSTYSRKTHNQYMDKSNSKRKRYEAIWNNFDSFLNPKEPQINILEVILKSECEVDELEEGLLNMHAVNRLAAIGKMLQYCIDNGMTIAEFMEKRTCQKIKARLNQRKSAESVGLCGSSYLPTLVEFDYLTSIGNNNIEFTIDLLKSQLSSWYGSTMGAVERELERVTAKNRTLLESIKSRICHSKSSTIKKYRAESDCTSIEI